jgi:hypothetical protein
MISFDKEFLTFFKKRGKAYFVFSFLNQSIDYNSCGLLELIIPS